MPATRRVLHRRASPGRRRSCFRIQNHVHPHGIACVPPRRSRRRETRVRDKRSIHTVRRASSVVLAPYPAGHGVFARAAARPPTAAPTTIDGATRGHRPRRALRRRTSCAQQVGGLLERRRHHELGYGHTAALQNVLRVEPVGEERHAAVAPARRAVPTQPSRTYAAQERRTTSQLSELPRPGGSTRRGTSAWLAMLLRGSKQRGQQAQQTRVS